MKIFAIFCGAILFNVGLYYVVFADSQAYTDFMEFDNLRLHQRFNDAEKLTDSKYVHAFFDKLRAEEKSMRGSAWYQLHKVHQGPFRRLQKEKSLPDGRVGLVVSQELLRGPLQLIGNRRLR